MPTLVYICTRNDQLKLRIESFFPEFFTDVALLLIDSIEILCRKLKKRGNNIVLIDTAISENIKEELQNLYSSFSGDKTKTILIVENENELNKYNINAEFETIDLIITQDFNDEYLLSYIKMLNLLTANERFPDSFQLKDILNINTKKIKFKHNIFDMLNQTNEGIWLWEIPSNTLYLSENFRQSLGYDTLQLHDDIEQFIQLIHPEDKKLFRLSVQSYLEHGEGQYNVELRLRHSAGNYVWFLLRGYAIWGHNQTPVKMIGIQLEINNIKVRMEILESMALYDPLTELPNRNLLYDRIKRGIVNSSRDYTNLGLLFIDLDKFKNINDTYGHRAGDLVLQESAKRLSNSVRKVDTVARLHGDEFIIVFPHISSTDDLSAFTSRIEKAFSTPMQIGEHTLAVTCSIGSSIYPNDGKTVDALLEKADQSMYKRKNIHKTLFTKPKKDE